MGKSKTQANPNGVRKVEASTRKELSPRSIRNKKRYLENCDDADLAKAQITR